MSEEKIVINTTNIEKSKILVVDDEANNRKLIQQMLKDHYLLSFAVNGKEALEVCKKVNPDMILLDIMMPEIDGFQASAHLKADPETSEIPIIFITAMNEAKDEVTGFELGCVDYITKPISKPILLARINTQLTISRQKKELALMNKSLEKQNQELSDLEKLRDGLTHMIAHDMKSPLMVIMGNLEMVKMQLGHNKEDTESLIKYIYGASNSAAKITNMIANMLDISKIEAEQMNLQLYKISLKQIVSNTIEMFDFIKGERSLTLEQSDTIPLFISDPNIIQRICQNLIDNAVKFTDQKSGKINVCIKKISDDRVKVSISDNGHGIPLEYHEKIFDKFFQVEAKKQRKVHSTGLGMAFCKLAAEAVGGTIGVESEIGRGSTFWFELPIREPLIQNKQDRKNS